MICSNCGTQNEAGRKFCSECAARLAIACPSCNAPNSPTAKFCGECATPLIAGAPPASAVARPGVTLAVARPVAERRLVSVLFADLVGFTTLAEGRDAEDSRELLSRYFDLARDVIRRYGGTVEKFIGDAVMAVWGAPTAHEDDAERSVRAALELVDAVTTLGLGIQARAAVLTGEAAVTLGATNEGMVAGDIVNTASRLQGAAAPGTVLVGEATQRAASSAIAFEPVGEQTLKGKAAPVPAWRALRVVAERGGRNRTEALEAPFVGRDEELRLLKDLFHATVREGRARLISVIGPAGIGKTRLGWEFSKYRDGLIEPVWFHDGRSPAYGEGISFWALGEMVRERAGLGEGDNEQTTRTSIAATVADHIADDGERRWIEPALLALLGIDAGSVAPDELFAAWRTFFERLAATAPVVMVFEDFHYADSGLIDFVDHLLEWSRAVPIYVVTLARPDFLERRPEWGAGKRSFTSIFLEPLSEAAMGALLAGLVPGLPDAAGRAIIARADGIPLYAVETVRMLLTQGQLALEDGVYRPVGDLTSLAVPDTLTALIASRLDALPADDRALVSDAAVLGQSFTLAGLAAVSGLSEEELQPRLRSLVRREILTLETDARSPERGQFAFVQALVREVAYNTLAKRDRKSRHLAAARFFESLDTDEVAGALAGHYLSAYRNAPEGAEADAVGVQARIALRSAAERAASLGSNDQATSFYEHVLAITTDPMEIAELLESAGEVASAAGRHDAAARHLHQAVEAYRELGDRPSTARATAGLSRALLDARSRTKALALLEPAAIEFADLATEPAVLAIGGQLARARFTMNQYQAAIDAAEPVLAAAEREDLAAILADTLVTKGSALAALDRVVEGLGVLRTGQDLAEARGLSATVSRAINNAASTVSDRDPRSGLELARAGLGLARRLGRRSDVAWQLGNAAWGALRTGDWSWALAEFETMPLDDLEAGDRFALAGDAALFMAFRGMPLDDHMKELAAVAGENTDRGKMGSYEVTRMLTLIAAGQLGEARAARSRAAELLAEPALLSNYGVRAALWSGDLAGAMDDLATNEGTAPQGTAVAADRLTMRAGIAALDGRPGDAMPLYREALRAYRSLGLAWDEALCGMDMAILLDRTDPEVRAAADIARETFVRLEAAPFIARLDAALVRSAEQARVAPALAEPQSVTPS